LIIGLSMLHPFEKSPWLRLMIPTVGQNKGSVKSTVYYTEKVEERLEQSIQQADRKADTADDPNNKEFTTSLISLFAAIKASVYFRELTGWIDLARNSAKRYRDLNLFV
jgi:hypothetical protein